MPQPMRTGLADGVRLPLGEHVRSRVEALHAQFVSAQPFAHVVIDDFLDADFAQALLDAFPAFEQGNFLNEDGVAGGKSTVERIRGLSGAYAALDDGVQSADFLELVGGITGIPDLLYDPEYFGGGTHENRHGQSLDSHIDFNYHPLTEWHRRLNLIVYLNPEWRSDWGGALELHRDPYDPEIDECVVVEPVFNRCVIFETTEHSWHGFSRIELPPNRGHLSRRSIALYFYTRERPAAQTAAKHSTVYVDRPLPGHFRAGRTLTERDVAELQDLLARRDAHNRRLYSDITTLQGHLDRSFASRLIGAARRVLARRPARAKGDGVGSA
jgi:hypothetical protein